MALSSDLISMFVKATKYNKKTKNETTVYGTIEEYDGTKYVRIDGSELLTPVSTTVDLSDAKDGERVAVMVKNHTAIATGNASSPAARIGTVQDLDGKVGSIYADYVETKELVAEKATIEQLNATNANIEKLEANKASVEQLTATNALINNLEANKADVEELEAERARIDDLDAKTADIEELEADSAFVKNLNAAYANINFANINMAAVEKIFAESGIIEDLVVSGERITGELVGVTIKGDLIEGNTIKADKLVVKGSDGLFYKLNFEGGALTGVSPSGEICYYKVDYDEETGTYSHGEEDVSDILFPDTQPEYVTVSTRIDDTYTTDGLEVYSLDVYAFKPDDNAGYPVAVDPSMIASSVTIDSTVCVHDYYRFDGIYRGTSPDGEEFYYTLEEGDPSRPYELTKTDYGFYCVTKPAADWAGNGLHGSVIVAKSIVAEKIAVDDLVAFDATIGGFRITDHSLYSGVKESVENDTRGSYIDDEGQVAFGDAVNYLRYFKDTDGTYKLDVSVSSVHLSSSNKSLDEALGDLQDDVDAVTKHLVFTNSGLEVGASNSDSKVIIDNDDVSILVKDAIVQKFDANGRALIPQLVITEAVNLLGYDLSLDNKRNLNCDYVGIKLEFLKNLSDMTVSVGETVVLSVVAIGEDVTYDWLQWDATVQQYERVANGSTYTVDTSTAGKQYFYCCAYDMNGGMKYSNGCCIAVV